MIDLDDDYAVVAATLWGEARGEGRDGIEAVAAVIANRVATAKVRPKRKQFGDGSFRSACLRPWQFSCWNQNDPNRERLLELDLTVRGSSAMKDCLEVARAAIAGDLADPTFGSLYYKVTSLPWPKDWGAFCEPLYVIGHHSFYRLDEE